MCLVGQLKTITNDEKVLQFSLSDYAVEAWTPSPKRMNNDLKQPGPLISVRDDFDIHVGYSLW